MLYFQKTISFIDNLFFFLYYFMMFINMHKTFMVSVLLGILAALGLSGFFILQSLNQLAIHVSYLRAFYPL